MDQAALNPEDSREPAGLWKVQPAYACLILLGESARYLSHKTEENKSPSDAVSRCMLAIKGGLEIESEGKMRDYAASWHGQQYAGSH